MKRFLVSASMMAMLMGGLAIPSLHGEEEVKGAVPARTDANNPDSAVYRASDIMNMPVKDSDGDEVGHIKDLVINGESREVLYAVVSMKDAKEKDAVYIMPWQVFQPYYGQGTALQYTVLTIPQSVWIQAPFYSLNQWRTVRYSQWAPRVNTYFASHMNQRGGRATGVKAAKPAITDDDVKDNAKRNDRTDKKTDTSKKSDTDKKNDGDRKTDSDKRSDSDRDRSDSKDRNDKPAPKNDSAKDAPAPKPAPNPVPKTEVPTPKAQNPVPNAPKIPAVPQPRDPKAIPK